MEMDGTPVCNLTGSLCFRNAIEASRDSLNTSKCLDECSDVQYDASKVTENVLDPFAYGLNFVNLLRNNTKNHLFEKESVNTIATESNYLEATTKRYSLVEVYFKPHENCYYTRCQNHVCWYGIRYRWYSGNISWNLNDNHNLYLMKFADS